MGAICCVASLTQREFLATADLWKDWWDTGVCQNASDYRCNLKAFLNYVLTKDVEQFKPRILYIQFVHLGYFSQSGIAFAFPARTSNWFIPHSVTQRGQRSEGFCRGLNSAPVFSQSSVGWGRRRVGLGLLQMVCCIPFLPFLGTCFH